MNNEKLKESIDFLEFCLDKKKYAQDLSNNKVSLYNLYFAGNDKLEESVRILLKHIKNKE